MYISIEGNIGCGKSTVWSLLEKKHPDWTFVKEPVDQWTQPLECGQSMLSLFQQDLAKNAQAFQMYALTTRAKCLEDGLTQAIGHAADQATATDPKCIVSERSPVTDKCIFQRMNESKFSECERHAYHTVQKNLNVKEPDLVVYLKCVPEVCLKRINQRNREGEDPISLDQLYELHKLHEDMSLRSNIAIISSEDDIEVVVANVERAIEIFRN